MNLQHLFENDQNNYIFNPLKIQILNDTIELLSIATPPVGYAYLKLDEGLGLVARDSAVNITNRDGAFAGGLDENDWSTGGKFSNGIEGKGLGYINLDNLIDFDRTDAFSFAFWIKYTSALTQFVITRQESGGIVDGYGVSIVTADFQFAIRDISNNKISVQTVNTYNDNVHHLVVCTYDGLSAAAGMKIYVDNVIDFSVTGIGPLTSTIIVPADFQIGARDGNNNPLRAGTILDDVMIFQRELTAADVSFLWNSGNGVQQLPGSPTAFPIDNPTIRPVRSQIINELINFIASIIEIGNDSVKFIIDINGVNYYYNTIDFEWQVSDGFLKSNTPAEILANIASLNSDIIQNTLVGYNWLAYMHSDNGSTTPKLQNVNSEYNAFSQGVNLNENTYEGNLFFINGIAANTKWLTVRSIKYNWGTNSQITNDEKSVIIQNNGKFSASIYIEDTEPDELLWNFEGVKVKTNFLAGNRKFSELTIISES